MPVTSPRWRTLWLALACALVLATPMHYRAEVHPANEAARVYAALAMVQHGTVALDPVFDRYFPGWRAGTRPPNVDVSWGQGRYVLDKAPGVTLLAVPVVGLLHAVGMDPGAPTAFPWVLWLLTVVVVGLPSALSLAHLAATLRAERAPPLAVALLATPWLAYGGLLFGHGLAAALVGSGTLLALGAPGGEASSGRRTALGGLLLGLAVLTEYPVAALAVTVVVAMLTDASRRLRLPWLLLGALGPAVALGAWNFACFGDPTSLSYSHKTNPEFAAVIAQGAFGVTWPSLGRLAELLAGPSRGLLHLAPWLVAGLVGAVAAARGRDLAVAWRVLLPLACLGFPVVISGFVDWQAGDSMGPRHLVPAIPLLGLAAALVLRDRPRLAAATWALVASSAALCVAGAWVYPYFPASVRNPLFEVVVPVLFDGGAPPAAMDALLPPPLGLACGLLALVALLGPPAVRSLRAVRHPAVALALALALALVHVVAAMLPETGGTEAERAVLQGRAAALDVLGHEAQAREIRKALRSRPPAGP